MAETVIDEIWEEKDGTIVLVLRQPQAWTDAGVMATLQDRLNGYISAIRDGVLLRKHPQYQGRPFKIRLVCFHDPPDDMRQKMDRVNHDLNQLGIRFHVMQIKIETPPEARTRLGKTIGSFFKRLMGSKSGV